MLELFSGLHSYEHNAPISAMADYPPDVDYMGVTEEGAPTVRNLITSDCVLKVYVSNPQ